MNVTFLLEDTAISGRAHAAMILADALVERGHRVRIATAGEPVTWRSSRAEWVYVDALSQYDPGEDVVIDRLPLVVESELLEPRPTRENEPLRVLLCGAWDIERHGVDDGYGAVAHARWFHQKIDLIRVSPWAPSREEPIEAAQEFLVRLTTVEMTRLMRDCDVLIAPNRRENTFSLYASEGLAAGLACVLTSIPTHLAWDARRDFALFAPADNAVELGERLIELLSDAELRDRLRARGRAVAEQWKVERAVDALEQELRDGAAGRPHPR
jgi:glycosyltransferase involved in cell wall biosynthesis